MKTLLKILIIAFLINPLPVFANKEKAKKNPQSIEEFQRQFGLTAAAQMAVESLQTEKIDPAQSLSGDCNQSATLQTPMVNRFDLMKKEVKKACHFFTLAPPTSYCEKMVEDIFEVGSPSCKTGDAGQAAASCTMGINYLLAQFQGAKKSQYESAIIKLQNIQNDILNGKRVLTSQSLFPLALEAANGNKEIAINLITAENLGFAGLTSFNNQLTDFPKAAMSTLKKWADQGGIFSELTKKFPDKNLRAVPEEDLKNVSSSKEYHYWPRAMMAQALLKKGYNRYMSRMMATSTSIVYEFHYDWKEHTQQGDKFTSKLSNALKDVALSDRGSSFGAKP
jgi:hypothetical protein